MGLEIRTRQGVVSEDCHVGSPQGNLPSKAMLS